MSSTVSVKDLVKYTGQGEWSALYINGLLDRVGEDYLVNERIFELVGLDERYDDSFMRGQDYREGVAQTIQAIEEYKARENKAFAEAESLRIQAAELLSKANEIMNSVQSDEG